LSAEANHHLALLIFGLNVHDAGGRMIDETERETSVGIGSRLMLLVEPHQRLARFAQSSGDTQLSAGDHGLIDHDLCHGGRHAGDEDGSG
jgi:hypothetical protein